MVSAVLATEGLTWILAAAFVAGLVRGFAGFGTAMIYLPVAGQFLDPFAAITTLFIMDIVGPLPNVPRALRDSEKPDLARLLAGTLVGLPIGLAVLSVVAPDVFRYIVSAVALTLLVILIGGFRYSGRLVPAVVYGTGATGGFFGGVAGIPGPPVILLYMASDRPPAVIRAQNTLFLFFFTFLAIAGVWVLGRLVPSAIAIGAAAILPYLAGNIIGAALFRPDMTALYRRVAYALIAASALSGLPIWD